MLAVTWILLDRELDMRSVTLQIITPSRDALEQGDLRRQQGLLFFSSCLVGSPDGRRVHTWGAHTLGVLKSELSDDRRGRARVTTGGRTSTPSRWQTSCTAPGTGTSRGRPWRSGLAGHSPLYLSLPLYIYPAENIQTSAGDHPSNTEECQTPHHRPAKTYLQLFL